MNRDYYPAGAYDDPNAPYNQCDPQEHAFDVEVGFSLFKDETVSSLDYTCDSGVEYDDEGGRFGYEDYQYEGCVEDDYKAEFLTPGQMLAEYRMMLTERLVDAFIISGGKTNRLINDLRHRIHCASGWTEESYY